MIESKEPVLVFASVRESDDPEWIDIECRFEDGQKFVAVQVEKEFPALAQQIAASLNASAPSCYTISPPPGPDGRVGPAPRS